MITIMTTIISGHIHQKNHPSVHMNPGPNQ